VADKKMQEEYARRNLIAAKACGIRAGIQAAINRLEGTKNPPKWLVQILKNEHLKSHEVCNEAAIHRDEVYDRAWKDAF